MKLYTAKKGFTLIELMVSVSIFVLVMTISMGAILAILDANQKSDTERSVVDNLDSTLESMTRTLRFGTDYHSTTVTNGSCLLNDPRDTQNGDDTSSMSVIDSNGIEVTYSLINGQIMRSENGGPLLALTSPDVDIQTLSFWVHGSYPYKDAGASCSGGTDTDKLQPFVVINIKGVVVGNRQSGTTFALETAVSQRQIDSQ
jgi:prepilin-type N-terminal cleavage/methylation domain-containing protein